MKALTFCVAFLVTMSASAAFNPRATLIGRHYAGSVGGISLLICDYAGARARFEILSQNGKCAPYIDVQ